MVCSAKCRLVMVSVISTLAFVWFALNLTLGNKQIDTRFVKLYSTADEQFPRAVSSILGRPLLNGNHVEELINGDQIFSAMLNAIENAESTVNFETYIFWSGSIGKIFADALIECAQRGVRVNVMLDWVGGRLDEARLRQMREHGVKVRRYNAPHLNNLTTLNNRTHRKLLVVDGKTGFIGGVGIADVWRGDAQDSNHWRDTHYQVRGPAVAQLQSAFVGNWMQATGEVLHGRTYFPPLKSAGQQQGQVFTSSPGGGAESMQLMYLLSITAAAKTVHISASYFIPDEVVINTLIAALKRGVKVKIILPGAHIDFDVVRRASRASWGKLLAAGAEIYEYQPTMYHVKTLIVDSLWVSVGSTNFDNRSFSINDEANLNIYDRHFAERQERIFEEDRTQSRRVTYEEWLNRDWVDKLLDQGASLFSAQL